MNSSALKTAKFNCLHLQKELEIPRTSWNKPEVVVHGKTEHEA